MHNDGGDDDGDDDDLVGGGGDGQDMQSLGPNWFRQCSSKLTALSFLAQVFVSYHQPSVVIYFSYQCDTQFGILEVMGDDYDFNARHQ